MTDPFNPDDSPSETTTVAQPTQSTTGNGRYPKLQPQQEHFLANGAASGKPAEILARAVGLELDHVRHLLNHPGKKLNELIEHARARQEMGDVMFRMEMSGYVDEAIKVVEKTLHQEKDPRLAYEVAKDILSVNRMRFPRDEKGPTIAQQFNFEDNRIAQSITTALGGILQDNNLVNDALAGTDSHTTVGRPQSTPTPDENTITVEPVNDTDVEPSTPPQEGEPG